VGEVAEVAEVDVVLEQARGEEIWSGELRPGDRLRVFIPQGQIGVRASDGRTARVNAEVRRGEDEVRFETLRDGRNVTICVVTEEVWECTSEGLNKRERDDHDDDPIVDVDVALPRGAHIRVVSGNGDVRVAGAEGEVRAGSGNGRVDVEGPAESVSASSGNGQVSVYGARGPVEARSGNGDVSVSTAAGPVSASSGNGDVRARFESIGTREEMTFATGNGDIELEVPADFSADLDVLLGGGDLRTDFELRLEGRMDRHHIRASVGGGGPPVRLRTGNGAVALRKI
jgi:hypothetical protein